MKATRRDTTWANIFECIRQHANSLHTALKSGFSCDCAAHTTYLRLEQRRTGDWSSIFYVAFTMPKDPKKTIKIRREVVIRVRKDDDQTEKSGTASSQSAGRGPLSDHSLNNLRHNFETKSSPQISVISRPILSSSQSISAASSHSSFRELFSKSTSVSSAVTSSSMKNGIECLVEESQSRYVFLKLNLHILRV